MEVMIDFVDKKEHVANLIEKYIENHENKSELINCVNEFSSDNDFKGVALFNNIFGEIDKYLSELSNKELKQRVLMIRSYLGD